jgi:hypothetical protein
MAATATELCPLLANEPETQATVRLDSSLTLPAR